MDKSKYCSIEVEFPKTGWVVVVRLFRYDGGKSLYPLMPVFTSTRMIMDRTTALKEEIGQLDLEISRELFLIPVSFEARFNLRPTYWDKPTAAYSQTTRVDCFARLVSKPQMYKLLVTPNEMVGGKFLLDAALPISRLNWEQDVELFMKMSDFGVNPTANAAGIYRVEEPFLFNWMTGEVVRESDKLNVGALN